MSVHPVGNHSVRSSSANAYLYPLFPAGANTSAVHLGLTVLPGHQATKIVWAADGGADAARATGVEYGAADGSGARTVVHAMREVIVSAGAIMSPAFLQHSGVGAPAELHAVGITPVVDLPSVGTNVSPRSTELFPRLSAFAAARPSHRRAILCEPHTGRRRTREYRRRRANVGQPRVSVPDTALRHTRR
jgi:choline dehydrogenase-like flavoprotein